MMFLLLFHGELHLLVYKVFELKYKKEVKQLIKNGIPENELVKFVFYYKTKMQNTKDIQWTKKNEFRFKGEMYDIVKEETCGDSVYTYCIHDFKESKLVKNYEKYFARFINDNPDKKKDLQIQYNSFSRFYNLSDFTIGHSLDRGKEQCFALKKYETKKGFYSTSLPPPKT
ncbi:MAG: hypothetical protein CVV23_01950 [Ignavibacteriae bacterium HGW-Ignavibacteriae-2]|jgi:hypothetical protein|nr:MAG: hypothetical protein CVV23_01950 [Ignavibacteriae bacterium HGW-Ignavibacteriae-2]